MTKYEIMFIVKPDMEETQINKVAESFKKVLTDNGAKITEENKIGQKELAYEIKKFNVGYYFFYVVESQKEAIEEFNRVARLSEDLLRSLVVKQDEREKKEPKRQERKRFNRNNSRFQRTRRPERKEEEQNNEQEEVKENNENNGEE